MKSEQIKKPNVESEYTYEQIKELQRCSVDPIYFMKTYMKVMHAKRGAIPFNMFPYQERCVKAFLDNTFTLIKMGRQMGKTTVISAYLLWFACFQFEKYILVASKDNDAAMDIMSKIRYSYEELPHWLKPGCIWNNRHEILFDNNSTIRSTATTENTGRGKALSCVTGDTLVTLRHKKTGKIFSTSMINLYSNVSSPSINNVNVQLSKPFEVSWHLHENNCAQITIT